MMAGTVERDVEEQPCLAHPRSAGDDDQIGALQTTQELIQPPKAGGDPQEELITL